MLKDTKLAVSKVKIFTFFAKSKPGAKTYYSDNFLNDDSSANDFYYFITKGVHSGKIYYFIVKMKKVYLHKNMFYLYLYSKFIWLLFFVQSRLVWPVRWCAYVAGLGIFVNVICFLAEIGLPCLLSFKFKDSSKKICIHTKECITI